MSLFCIVVGIFIIAFGVIFFYKNKQRRLAYLATAVAQLAESKDTKLEPIIKLETINASEKDDTSYLFNLAIPQLDDPDHLMDKIVINGLAEEDLIEEKRVVFMDKKMVDSDNTDIILLQVKALADRPYTGYELLQVLTSAGLIFGEMGIFHGNNFSVAAATTTGSFPVDNMGSFKCLGLVVFMRLNPQKKLMMTFDLMLNTARQLVEELDGEIYDDLNQSINATTIKRLQEKIYTIEANILYTSDLLNSLDNL